LSTKTRKIIDQIINKIGINGIILKLIENWIEYSEKDNETRNKYPFGIIEISQPQRGM
jgi:hypothetical protein